MKPPSCSATTRWGKPCGFAARRDSGLCINHDPAYKEQQARNRERGMRNSLAVRQASPIRLQDFDLADRSSVQALIDTILRLELTGSLPEARSSRLICLLSIAIRNFDPPNFVPYQGRRARHDRPRYELLRRALEPKLPDILALAESRDAARHADN